MKQLLFASIFALMFIATGCTKTGPQGPVGPQGPTGNANVIGSDHITVSSWTYLSASATYTATFTYDQITTNVANYGLVMVYKQYDDGSWTALPDQNGITSTVCNFSTNTFTLYIFNVDGSIPNAPGSLTFRLVVIPSSYKQAYPNEDWKNYNRTMQLLGKSAPAQSI